VNVRVLIADDDPVMRMLLGAIISRAPELDVAGEAEDADGAIAAAERLSPDVALLDLEMPGGGGPAAARAIRERAPGVRVLALSAHEDDAARTEMADAGAVGYVVKGAPPDAIVQAIRAAAAP
jgi:DNA-binding NarL/FixJ family response regulator